MTYLHGTGWKPIFQTDEHRSAKVNGEQGILKGMQFAKSIIMYNPKSTGDGHKNAQKFAKKLLRAGVADSVEVVATKRRRHAEKMVASLAAKHQPLLVVSSSGDGGYNEVVNGALTAKAHGNRVVTGLLPSGNANDHYKALHKPYVIRRLKKGNFQDIDVLKIETTIKGQSWQRYAHSYIGFGITSDIGRELNKHDLTPAKELIISAKAFMEFEAFEAKVDGKKQSFHSILANNIGRMSKVFKIGKDARPDDGKFELITGEDDKAKLITAMVKSATIGVPHERQVRSFTFETLSLLSVQLDGEVFTIDAGVKVRVSVDSRGLQCII